MNGYLEDASTETGPAEYSRFLASVPSEVLGGIGLARSGSV